MVKQKVVAMETQYKLAVRSAQLLGKEAPPDEAARVMAAMTTAKSQLSRVGAIKTSNGDPIPVLSDDRWRWHSGERTMPRSREGMPHPSAPAGGNGETHHGFLPVTGAGQSHHLCCQRPRHANLEPAETKVAGQI